MGMTVEFYSAEPRELLELFSVRNADEDFNAFFEKLEVYPVADFSFHLQLPEDLDNLCRILRKRNLHFPYLFSDLFIEQVWSDGVSESLTLLTEDFTSMLATLSEREIEQAALEWAATFPYQKPLQHTPAYQSLLQLRAVAVDAHTQGQSLLFYLEGIPTFFR